LYLIFKEVSLAPHLGNFECSTPKHNLKIEVSNKPNVV
jgi:hypothetical protein